MAKQVFDSKDPQSLAKLDQLWRQLRNSHVMDGREFVAEYDRDGFISTLTVAFGPSAIEAKQEADLAAKQADKAAVEQEARDRAAKARADRKKQSKPDGGNSAASASGAGGEQSSGSSSQ